MSEIRNESQLTWADKKKSKRWFTAWVVTAAALVASNLAWILGEMK